jgi:hypothetical protein
MKIDAISSSENVTGLTLDVRTQKTTSFKINMNVTFLTPLGRLMNARKPDICSLSVFRCEETKYLKFVGLYLLTDL